MKLAARPMSANSPATEVNVIASVGLVPTMMLFSSVTYRAPGLPRTTSDHKGYGADKQAVIDLNQKN
jgi:hypothetical protein